MNRNAYIFCFLVLALVGLGACSSKPTAEQAKNAETAPDKIQGKAQIADADTARDLALSAGGSTVYIWDGLNRYHLFVKTPIEVTPGKQYVVEGVDAQKAIDEIGDPDQGKNGYPLLPSCERVVRMAWKGLAIDVVDVHATSLRAMVRRFPARHVFLVRSISPVASEATAPRRKRRTSRKSLSMRRSSALF